MDIRTADVAVTDPAIYRRNVGIALLNAQGLVLIGRRFRDDGPGNHSARTGVADAARRHRRR